MKQIPVYQNESEGKQEWEEYVPFGIPKYYAPI